MKFLLVAGFANSLIGFRKPLIKALLEKGFLVHVAAPDLISNKAVVSELSELGVICHEVPIHRTGMSPAQDCRALFVLWSIMRKIQPDYFLGYTIKPVVYGSLAAWLARVPKRFALVTGLGFAFIEGGGKRDRVKVLVQWLYRIALKCCHNVFFQNPDDQALFKKLKILGVDALSCIVNGSGVDISEFNVEPLTTDSPTRFLLIGRLLGDKGVREYAQAAIEVKKEHPEVQFDLVGWIDENPNSISQLELEEWTADGTMNYLGRLTDVKPAIKNCSVYVLPSYREGTPRTVLEAMAMGRAIITTDAPGCRETVTDGKNGFLIPIKNVQALTNAMLQLIEKPELLKKMSAQSRIIAENKYDVHKVNLQMLKGMNI